MHKFLDIEGARKFAEQAGHHYLKEQAPGWFTDWLDDLYIRIGEGTDYHVAELLTLQRLYDEGQWAHQHLAVNATYKLFDRLGWDLTGKCDH